MPSAMDVRSAIQADSYPSPASVSPIRSTSLLPQSGGGTAASQSSQVPGERDAQMPQVGAR
jgi:hypothetical protein